MPRPKLPREVVDTVVELLLCGWTPQDVVASWPSWGHYDLNCPSLVSIRGIASAEGLGRPRGAQPGRPRPQGAGRKFSGGKGTGTKYSTRRDEVRRLRSEGLSHQTIAGLVGVSRQQVANLLSDGRVGWGAQFIAGLIKNNPSCEKFYVSETDDKHATVVYKRKGEPEGKYTFTVDKARQMGFIKSGGAWEKFPGTMCRWAAMRECARMVWPDVVTGVYTPDEIAQGELPEEMIATMVSRG